MPPFFLSIGQKLWSFMCAWTWDRFPREKGKDMKTVRIIHTTAANEAAGNAMLALLFILAVIGVGIYTVGHRLLAETSVPIEQLDMTWNEPDRERFDNDPFYGGGTAGASYVRDSYDIAVDIRNNSPYRLYSVDYEATLHVCDTLDQQAEDCPIVGTATGQLSPDLVSSGHGIQKASLTFGKAHDYIGYGRLSMRWTDAHGVSE